MRSIPAAYGGRPGNRAGFSPCHSGRVATWNRYVALGDSFTEGMDDPYPDGTYRGWADLVAASLADKALAGGRSASYTARPTEDFGYANLAVRGRLLPRVIDEQVPAALALRPDLVSFAAGGNDALRRNFDPAAVTGRFDRTVRELRAAGADVIVFQFADVTRRLPGRRYVLPRVQVMNDAVRATAERHGAYLVDLWTDEEFHPPALWSLDRLHLNAAGHRRVAAHVLMALGLAPDPAWLSSPPPAPPLSWPARRAADARWARQHFAPWIRRRLTGRSSGDQVAAKRPALGPVDN